MSLVVADLLALLNLVRTRSGRRTALGMAGGLALLALMASWLAEALLDHPRLAHALGGGLGPPPLHGLFGHALSACPAVAAWLGLAIGQRQLFESPEADLWRSAPLPSTRPALQVLLRALFVSTLWAAALAGPFAVALLQRQGAPAWAYALLAPVLAACTVPLLATLLAVQIVVIRLFAGRTLRLVLLVLAALASVAFAAFLLQGLFASSGERLRVAAQAATAPPRLPWAVDGGARLLAAACSARFDGAAALLAFGWPAAAIVAFVLAARLHDRAAERHREAAAHGRRRRRAWPGALWANVLRKEFAQVVQQPGALVGFLVFGVLVFVLVERRVLIDQVLLLPRVPAELRTIAGLVVAWFLAVLLGLYAHMGRLALWDGAQWSLYVAAPARVGAIVGGKLLAIATLLAWPLVLVGGAGALLLDATPFSLLAYLGIALGGTGVAIAALAIVGTLPWLMRPDASGQIVQGGKAFVAAMLLVFTFHLAVLPAVVVWHALVELVDRRELDADGVHELAPLLVGGALACGAAAALFGAFVGTRNYRRLVAPR